MSHPVRQRQGVVDDLPFRACVQDFVRGPYRCEVPAGIGHFVMDQAGELATERIAAHIAASPLRA